MNEFDVNEFTTSEDDSDFLGSGSYASVRRCRHKQLRTVVVKCFRLTGSGLAINQQSKNISKEAEVLCRLEHKNIIKVFGVTKWSTRYGIVMEEAADYNLEDLFILESNRDIPWPVRLRFMSEIAEGLKYLHCHDAKRSYIHGDLKLQNILLSDRLEIKIADFGAVSLLQATGASSSSLTVDPSNKHTKLYSAPELLKNPEMQRTRAMDIYSYAMIGYEIITRQQVFCSSKANLGIIFSLIISLGQKPNTSLIDQIKNDLTNPIDSEICSAIEAIVVGCWKTNPNDRLDIQNVIARLEHLTDHISDPQHDALRLRKNTTSVSSTQISLKKFDRGFETSASSSESFSNDPKLKRNKDVFPKFFIPNTSYSADEMESEMVEEEKLSSSSESPEEFPLVAPLQNVRSTTDEDQAAGDVIKGENVVKVEYVTGNIYVGGKDCLTPENCLEIFNMEKQHICYKSREKIYEYICKNFKAVTETPSFKTRASVMFFFTVYELKKKFYVNDEFLFQSLMDWTKFDEEERKEQFHRITNLVNVDKLSYEAIKKLLNESLIEPNRDFYSRLKKRMEQLLKGTKILSIGGYATGTTVKIVYDLDDDTKKVYPDLPFPFYAHRSVILDNYLYNIGGISNKKESNKVLRLNLKQDGSDWEEIAVLIGIRCHHGAAVLDDNIVVCGGYTSRSKVSLTEAYDPKLNDWRQIRSLTEGRAEIQSVTSGGCLYAIGGKIGMRMVSKVERLDGLDQSWKTVSSMETPRYRFAAVECNNFIYAIGGLNNDNKAVKSVEKYDCERDRWIYVREMNIERYGHSACVMLGKIYVVGGCNFEGQRIKEMECYDPSDDKWEVVNRIDDEFSLHSLVVLYH